jgi:hypothetical protein
VPHRVLSMADVGKCYDLYLHHNRMSFLVR